ncbi:MAG: NAD(P)H-dependent oxidoreductase subunit E [Clostridia bacterium]|nr:NAD(P)H-dependent oxidoreductase subunit E [Clostridia bacterium]
MRTNEEMFNELDRFIEQECNCDEQELIAILHRAQEIFGYLPMVVQAHVARKLGINVSKVYGVVSFYSFFSMEPKGEYVISICMGTACFVRGSDKILERVEQILGIKNGQTTADGKFTITTLRCVGACGLAPVLQINDKTYGNITPEDVESIIAQY